MIFCVIAFGYYILCMVKLASQAHPNTKQYDDYHENDDDVDHNLNVGAAGGGGGAGWC